MIHGKAFFMSRAEIVRYRQEPTLQTSIWEYLVYISISLVLMFGAGKLALSLYPDGADALGTERVASETFIQYSQKLDDISSEFAKDLDPKK
jgi:hypothetical protein